MQKNFVTKNDSIFSGLLRMDMISTPSTSSSGSPCSRISMRSSTTTTWTARSVSSARSWGSPNTTEQLPRSSSQDSSKFCCYNDLHFFLLSVANLSSFKVKHNFILSVNVIFNSNFNFFQICQVPWGLEPARRHEGAFGRVSGRQLKGRAEQGLRGVLPVPVLHQGLHEEESGHQQPLKRCNS